MNILKENHADRKEKITNKIKQIHDKSKQIYGAPKITRLLQKNGEKVQSQ